MSDDDETIRCALAGDCAFEGPWSEYLDHAPTHPLPHPDDRPAWLAARRTFLGASEIATVCGISPWSSALDVFAAKVIGAEKASTPAMQRGVLLEPVLLASYAARHGVELVRPSARRHRDLPWIGATPDAEYWRPHGWLDRAPLVEIKTVDARGAWAWEDGPPLHVVMQVQQQLAVFDRDVCHVVALLGSDMLEHEYEVRADESAFAQSVELADVFWRESVRARRLPVDFDSAPSKETLRALFPSALDIDLVEAGEEERRLVLAYDEARERAKTAAEEQEALAVRLKVAIGDRSGFAWGPAKKPLGKATWKNNAAGVDKGALLDHLLARYTTAERAEFLEMFTAEIGPRVLRVTVRK